MIDQAEIIKTPDLKAMDRDLLEPVSGRVRLMLASEWRKIPLDQLRAWCHHRARYGIPTIELVDFLKGYVVPKRTIEVGAGMGDLGFHLGIRMTDSFAQVRNPLVKNFMGAFKQPPTEPPSDVRELDALKAVHKYQPTVVIASWLTQKYVQGDGEARIGSSVYGPDEVSLVNGCQTYVHIGNYSVHGDKRALLLPHTEIAGDWLVSRAANQKGNFIAVWGK